VRSAFEMFRAQMDEKSIRCELDTEELATLREVLGKNK